MKKFKIITLFFVLVIITVLAPRVSFAASQDGECGTGTDISATGISSIPTPSNNSAQIDAGKPKANLCIYGIPVQDKYGNPAVVQKGDNWIWICKGVEGGKNSPECSLPVSVYNGSAVDNPTDTTGAAAKSTPTTSSKGGGGGSHLVPSCPGGVCGFNELMIMINRIINFILLDIATPIAAIVFVYAGILLIFSGGDSGKITKAKAMIKNLIIGFVIVLAAWLIVNTILSTLGFQGSFLTKY